MSKLLLAAALMLACSDDYEGVVTLHVDVILVNGGDIVVDGQSAGAGFILDMEFASEAELFSWEGITIAATPRNATEAQQLRLRSYCMQFDEVSGVRAETKRYEIYADIDGTYTSTDMSGTCTDGDGTIDWSNGGGE